MGHTMGGVQLPSPTLAVRADRLAARLSARWAALRVAPIACGSMYWRFWLFRSQPSSLV